MAGVLDELGRPNLTEEPMPLPARRRRRFRHQVHDPISRDEPAVRLGQGDYFNRTRRPERRLSRDRCPPRRDAESPRWARRPGRSAGEGRHEALFHWVPGKAVQPRSVMSTSTPTKALRAMWRARPDAHGAPIAAAHDEGRRGRRRRVRPQPAPREPTGQPKAWKYSEGALVQGRR